mmetsp:Transcript_42512/g.69079  ORF Transcript_42512/g.69079 Transcript_42512/m.69079 type:complete len:116 (+) Transcript_42512:662-1009(+)
MLSSIAAAAGMESGMTPARVILRVSEKAGTASSVERNHPVETIYVVVRAPCINKHKAMDIPQYCFNRTDAKSLFSILENRNLNKECYAMLEWFSLLPTIYIYIMWFSHYMFDIVD